MQASMHKSARRTPAVLIVLDGWGHSEETEHNAIAQAKTPFVDSLYRNYPHALIDASGCSVGLPEGQMGNSEVGHMVLGAGTPIDTDLVRIDKAAACDGFHCNPEFQNLFAHVKKHNSTLHVQGLLSPGGVHSHQKHLFAFMRAAKDAGVTKIAIHVFLDGRDTPPQSGADFLEELEEFHQKLGLGRIVSAVGRFYAMDRDNNWDRLCKAECAIHEGKSDKMCYDERPSTVLRKLYKEGVTDEYLEPIIFIDEHGHNEHLHQDDGLFFWNFRADRARMLTRKELEYVHDENIYFVTLTRYDKTHTCATAFPPYHPEATLASEVSGAGLTQAHVAETEKYAHATYFLNGGIEELHRGEQHILIESRKDVPTHDLAPEMKAKEITDAVLNEVEKGTDFIFINYANADMVGHTANTDALHIAIETIDRELARLIPAVQEKGGFVFITADHGNAEQNFDAATNAKHTAHTTNFVPAILVDDRYKKLRGGSLADVAPTMLSLMNLPIPKSMTGRSLVADC
jgi:2,3-bisphosphoglycerate-independent phosphoglycerate mutase